LLFQGNSGYANVSHCYVIRPFACPVKSHTDSQIGLVNFSGLTARLWTLAPSNFSKHSSASALLHRLEERVTN